MLLCSWMLQTSAFYVFTALLTATTTPTRDFKHLFRVDNAVSTPTIQTSYKVSKYLPPPQKLTQDFQYHPFGSWLLCMQPFQLFQPPMSTLRPITTAQKQQRSAGQSASAADPTRAAIASTVRISPRRAAGPIGDVSVSGADVTSSALPRRSRRLSDRRAAPPPTADGLQSGERAAQ